MRILSHIDCPVTKKQAEAFASWVLSVGDGTVPTFRMQNDDETQWIEISEDLLIPNGPIALQTLIATIYPNFVAMHDNHSYLKERAINTLKNVDANRINSLLLDELSSSQFIYYSHDFVERLPNDNGVDELQYPTEYLNTLEFSSLPAHQLKLKVGVPVIMLRNLNQKKGLCNGTRLIITKLFGKIIEAEILTGSHVGQKCIILRITLSPNKVSLPFVFKRRQYLIRLCFATTINKSQGQTLKHVGVYLRRPVFSHGQLYVAVSRVQNKSGLKILTDNTDIPECPGPNYTENIIYKEVFKKVNKNNM